MPGSDGASLLRHVVLLPVRSDAVVVLSGQRCVELVSDGTFDPGEAWALLARGLESARCARELGCSFASIEEFRGTLRSAGLTAQVDGDRDLGREKAVELLVDSAAMWMRHSLLHPIFRVLADDDEHKPLLAALLVEICHYAHQMPAIASIAAERVSAAAARSALADFAEEEADHYKSMANGAAELLGCRAEDVIGSHPAPATIGLLSTIEVLSRRDPAAFGAILCFTETAPAVAERAAEDFLTLASKNDVPESSVRPVADHVLEDGELSHGDIGAEILEAELPAVVPGERLSGIARGVHDVKHGFDLLYDSLLSASSAGAPYTLRSGISWNRL